MRTSILDQGRGWAIGPALLLSLLAPATAAQEGRHPDQDPIPKTAQEASTERQKALKRVLYLYTGTTLRGVSRRAEGGWEYKRGGKWRLLPDAAVERAALEKDLKRELKVRRAQALEGDESARAEAADWALSAGLLAEGLAEIDRVLAREPDQPQALAAIRDHEHRFRVPAVDPAEADVAKAADALVRWAAPRSASSREMAVLELERASDREGLEGALQSALFASSVKRRSFAAHALRRLYPGKQLKPLLQRAVLDSSEQVRRNAAWALRTADETALVAPVLRAMGSSHPRVRIQAAEALGNMGYAAAVEPLVARLAALQGVSGGRVPHANIFVGRQFAYLQDFDVEVAQFQAVADPQINVLMEGQVTDAGVVAVKEVQVVAERSAIRGALQQLTGASPGRNTRSWLNWWEENKASFNDPASTGQADR